MQRRVCEGVGRLGCLCQTPGAQAWAVYESWSVLPYSAQHCVCVSAEPEAGAGCMASFLAPAWLSSGLCPSSRVLTGDQGLQGEVRQELPLIWETGSEMSGLRSGSQCQPSSAPRFLRAHQPRPASVLVSVPLAMFCRLLCLLPVAVASGELEGPSPSQKALLNALLTPSPSFKKRRGHSIGGAPEQRYQSIPVYVTTRLPTQAHDVLVRRSWAKCMGYHMGVPVPGAVSGGWGSKDRPFSGSSFPPTACAGSPLAFYNERERQEAR